MLDHVIKPNWPAPTTVKAFTTTAATPENFLDSLPYNLPRIKQVHGITVQCIDQQASDSIPEADAAIAFTAKKICAIRTADCLPILICDKAGTQVAAVHAGWRGLAAGIVQNTCTKLTAPLHQCLAWIGPAIGPQAFEVGQDVLDNFVANGWPTSEINAAFTSRQDKPGKWLGNLYQLARYTLQQQGIPADNIYGGDYCTYSDPELFHSYRRSATTARMVSLIWRD